MDLTTGRTYYKIKYTTKKNAAEQVQTVLADSEKEAIIYLRFLVADFGWDGVEKIISTLRIEA